MLVQDTKMDRFVTNGMLYPSVLGPMRAVDTFIEAHGDDFVIDRRFEYLMYSQHHRGFLRRKHPKNV
jgi:cephalosporin hydroxylase